MVSLVHKMVAVLAIATITVSDVHSAAPVGSPSPDQVGRG